MVLDGGGWFLSLATCDPPGLRDFEWGTNNTWWRKMIWEQSAVGVMKPGRCCDLLLILCLLQHFEYLEQFRGQDKHCQKPCCLIKYSYSNYISLPNGGGGSDEEEFATNLRGDGKCPDLCKKWETLLMLFIIDEDWGGHRLPFKVLGKKVLV